MRPPSRRRPNRPRPRRPAPRCRPAPSPPATPATRSRSASTRRRSSWRAARCSRWRNIQDVPAAELRFHLYWNGWRNDHSTWMREERLTGGLPHDSGPTPGAGSTWARSGSAVGEDLTEAARFDSPDDGNPDDRTVLVVPLPAPVAPGRDGRGGHGLDAPRSREPSPAPASAGDYFFVAHWFPKLGVFEGADGWNCHQFHSNTEFYSDYGVYDVTITHAGALRGRGHRAGGRTEPAEDGSVAHRFVQEDVHAFTWTASPDYLVATDRFEVRGPAAGRPAPPLPAGARAPGGAPLRRHEAHPAALRHLVRPLSRTTTSRSSIRPGRAAPAAWSTRRSSPPAPASSTRSGAGARRG